MMGVKILSNRFKYGQYENIFYFFCGYEVCLVWIESHPNLKLNIHDHSGKWADFFSTLFLEFNLGVHEKKNTAL